jgi:N-acetylmuramoyl-L-alanine amidase
MSKLSRSAWLSIMALCALTIGSVSAPAGALDIATRPLSSASSAAVSMTLDLSDTLSDAAVTSGTVLEPNGSDQETVATSLSQLVAAHASDEPGDRDEECLATAVFYEAKSESLEGQLAVAQVVLNRAGSGRFPSTVCSVITQPRQFGFVRGGTLPSVSRSLPAWKRAVAVARIAARSLWKPIAPNSLYFHAARVSPRWSSAVRVATIGNHIFYR